MRRAEPRALSLETIFEKKRMVQPFYWRAMLPFILANYRFRRVRISVPVGRQIRHPRVVKCCGGHACWQRWPVGRLFRAEQNCEHPQVRHCFGFFSSANN